MKKIIKALALMMIIVSCNNQKATDAAVNHSKGTDTSASASSAMAASKEKSESKPKYTPDMVDNKKDFSCGMSVKSGIEDTCHYKGKVYGFCCTECKEDFLKSPETMLKAQ